MNIGAIIPREIPIEPGCLSVLMHVQPGEPLQAAGDVPAALIGAKWPDVRTWAVLWWMCGIAYAAVLKTETPAPWDITEICKHWNAHPECWRKIAENKETSA